jgi:hypothetical protein
VSGGGAGGSAALVVAGSLEPRAPQLAERES